MIVSYDARREGALAQTKCRIPLWIKRPDSAVPSRYAKLRKCCSTIPADPPLCGGAQIAYPIWMSVVPPQWTREFEEAGWRPGRNVPVDSRVPPEHPAHGVLAELGGLELNMMYGDYEVCEASFQYLAHKDRRVERWETALHIRLIGIAEHHNAHGELHMSDKGQVFLNSIIHPAFGLVGRSFNEAIDNLLAKRNPRPMLLADDNSIMIGGVALTHADPEVLGPSSPELR
jgi:hypothetical protein